MATILIVEDELAGLYKEALCLLGDGRHIIFVASRGDEGVRKAKSLRPELIIMDLRLPGKLSGTAAIKRIRVFDEQVPILAMTAFNDEYNRQEVMKAGATEYLVKPVDMETLLATVSQLLGNNEVGLEAKK